MNRLFERLTTIYPDIDFLAGGIVLQDDSDGKGAYIKQWNSTLAQPTEAQLLAVVLPSEQDIKKRAAIKTAIAAIESAYTTEKEAPITYAGHVFQADAGSVELMTQVASALPAGASVDWYDIANTAVPLTDVQFAELRGAILMRGQLLFKKRRQLKDAINSATTVADVEAISW